MDKAAAGLGLGFEHFLFLYTPFLAFFCTLNAPKALAVVPFAVSMHTMERRIPGRDETLDIPTIIWGRWGENETGHGKHSMRDDWSSDDRHSFVQRAKSEI